MLTGVALTLSEIPPDLVAQHNLARLVHTRDSEREVRFLFAAAERRLPVLVDGQLAVVRWGNRRGESWRLPLSGWTWRMSVEAGAWTESGAESVVISARLGLDRGIWFLVREGIEALLVKDEHGLPRVYPVVEPASHYYQIMTKSAWMPC